jgi:hypothetical protein
MPQLPAKVLIHRCMQDACCRDLDESIGDIYGTQSPIACLWLILIDSLNGFQDTFLTCNEV